MSKALRLGVALGTTGWVALVTGCAVIDGPSRLAAEPGVERKSEPYYGGAYRREAYVGPYFHDRYGYPTGRVDSRWWLEAQPGFDAVSTGVPAGAAETRGRALPAGQATLIGPQPLIQTGGGAGTGAVAGRINVILSHPTNPAIAWAGSDGGGVWKTTNCCTAQTTWRTTTDLPAISSIAIGDMTMDPSNPDVIYAGTGDLRYGSFSFGSAGLLKSIDGGESWVVLGEDVFNPFYPPSAGGFPQYQSIGVVRVDRNASSRVVVGTKTGLFLSYDGGLNWAGPCRTNEFTTQRQDITGLVLKDEGSTTQIIAAVGTRGFGTPVQPDLTNNGANGIYAAAMPASGCPANWQLMSRPDNGWLATTGDGQPDTDIGRISLEAAPSDPNTMYAKAAIATSASTIRGIWRTTNGGATWTNVGTLAATGCANANVQSWYNAGLVIHPTDPNTFFPRAVDQYRSTDGGTTITNITCGYGGGNVHVDQHAATFVANNPDRLLIGNDGGVYYTENPYNTAGRPTFIPLNQQLPTIEFYTGDITANFANSQNAGAVGGAQDNGTSVSTWSNGQPQSQPWNARLGGDGMFARIEPVLGQRWYMSSQNGNIRASTTGPNGAVSTTVNPSWGSDRKSFITPFEIYKHGGETTGCPAATGCVRMIAGTFRVWESVQGGIPSTSWYISSPDLTDNPPTIGDRAFVNQLDYAVSDPRVAIAGTNDGNVWFGFNMGQGIGNTASWVNVTGGNAVLPNRPVLDVATDPQDPLVGYAALGGFDQNTPTTPGRVYQVRCTADCASFQWRNITGNLPNIPANSVIANPLNRKQVFLGTDWGLFFTDNVDAANPVWVRFEAGLPNVMIWDMTIDRGFTTLALWTRSRGAYVIPLPAAPNDADRVFRNGFEG
jgi:hypothetical protein